MATTKIKRPLAPRTNEVDRLASKLSSNLKISNVPNNGTRTRRGTRVALTKATDSPEESKAAAMRSINNVLQSLASPAGVKGGSSTLVASATAGRAALTILRKLDPQLLDTERAALSMVGKLLALDIHDPTVGILEDVRKHFPSFYTTMEVSTTTRPPISLLQLPLPTSSLEADAQTCIQIYLSHAFSVVTRAVSTNARLFDAFHDVLRSRAGLQSWLPFLTGISHKSLDGLFKRIYVTLTTAFASPPELPSHVLKIRFRALHILLLSSEVDVTPFWEQCLKYAASYARSAEAKESENEKLSMLLESLSCIDEAADGRREGKGWISFCEYWLALAKRAGDMQTFNVVAGYIYSATSKNDVSQLIPRSCTTLSQLVASLDQPGGDDGQLNLRAEAAISELRRLQSLFTGETLDSKLRRIVEKCRKSALQALSRFQPGTSERDTIIQVLESIVAFLEHIVNASAETTAEHRDATVSSLDALFQLATCVLNVQRADTCDQAYDYLMRALRLIERSPSNNPENKRTIANYLRCLAGAHANLAGALYKDERYGIAIRFLKQACPLSTRASECSSGNSSSSPSSEFEKDREAWKTHRAQVYRRWELFGVCYVKTGDRRLAYEAFLQGVINYPFDDELASSAGGSDVLQTSPIANAVDRLTHVGVVDLRLEPKEVSLREPLVALGVPASVLGSILVRQAFSLSERSKPLVRMAVSAFLANALDVYDAARFPVRRARTLVLVLEHTYYGVDKDAVLDQFHPQGIVQEMESLLSDKASMGEDSSLAHLRLYYRATIMLWVILHAHRTAESPELIAGHTKVVLNALEAFFAEPAGGLGVKERSVGRVRKAPATTVSRAGSKSRIAQRAAVSSSRSRTKTTNTKRQTPTTSQSNGGSCDGTHTGSSPTDSQALNDTDRLSLIGLVRLSTVMVAELLNLPGLVLEKLQLLISVRRLSERFGDTTSEVYLHASAMLAHVLSKLGKNAFACTILAPLATVVSDSALASPSSVLLLLRYAELLALDGDIPKSLSLYENAYLLSENLPDEESSKSISALSRIRARATSLERVAMAATVFAAIQDTKNEPASSLETLLQALRLLNRATETLARLNPTRKPDTPDESDPFAMSSMKNALPAMQSNDIPSSASRTPRPRANLDGLEWRISNALLETQLALAQAYAARGSVREAEYFEQQAEELARVLGTPAMMTQALLLKSELKMGLGCSDEAQRILEEAMALICDEGSLDEADMHRSVGDHLLLCSKEVDAHGEFEQAAKTLARTMQSFSSLEKQISKAPKLDSQDTFAPILQAKILRQQVWLLRDELGEEYERLLEKLFALPQRPYIEVHVNSVLGRLALYDLHERFRADMSLSSLAESTIALPMGMACENSMLQALPQDIRDALEQADEHYTSDLSRFAERDSVVNVRGAAIAEALISTYQASLGIEYEDSPAFASRLLDMASSITLRRELIDAIAYKFPYPMDQDDMRWPSETPRVAPKLHGKPKGRSIFDDLSDDDEDSIDNSRLRRYWNYILKKHQSEAFIRADEITSDVDKLPDNWMVISVSLTDDRSALLLSRQRPKHGPTVFCVPLKDRREEDEGGHFTFDQAMTELSEIIKLNDEGARGASQIKSDDKEAKMAWWASRKQLDQRMKDLVENIEFCWLGAFKTILSQPVHIPTDAISGLRTRIEKVFKGILSSHEKKSRKAKLRLETNLLELFAALPPTCRDEELQDIVYFVLDLYHFHGLPIALSEVDIDVVVVDLRSALEEYHSRARGRVEPEADTHTFLVLDKNVQGIPWESLPILRGHSVSRVPSIAFITDRLAWVRCQRGLSLEPEEDIDGRNERLDRVLVDASKGFYVLNPSGDLSGTEGRFKGWAQNLRKVGWEGVIGSAPSEQQFLNALSKKDLVVYFGHGGAEQYARSHRIRHLQRCAATMLWGCSSGALREMGSFDRIGTPNNYMLAGCPSLVANLWDVTDRDIDKFAQSVFSKLRLEPGEIGKWQKGKRGLQDGKVSIVAAVAQSRDVCKLKYLTGAAVVVYGIPYYL